MPSIDLDRLSQAVLAKLLHLGDSLALAAAVFVGMLAVGAIAAALLRGAARRQPRHAALLGILARAAWIAGLILAALSALQNLGVNVTAFVTSLGLAAATWIPRLRFSPWL